ncbi:hypothetical protein FRC08_004980 [Ceratobasidium sp. 394]|nr:hypothetical protein FRC08_004980 [Ceratobasidium sp. 394]
MFTETKHAPQFTPRWTAPELMEEDGISQSQEADVYALGMTILEIITGKVPYYYINNVLAMIRTIAFKKELPRRPEDNIPSNSRHGDVLWSLLEGCWEFEPKKRPGATGVANIMSGITREGLMPGQIGSEGPAHVASASGQPAESHDVE